MGLGCVGYKNIYVYIYTYIYMFIYIRDHVSTLRRQAFQDATFNAMLQISLQASG